MVKVNNKEPLEFTKRHVRHFPKHGCRYYDQMRLKLNFCPSRKILFSANLTPKF